MALDSSAVEKIAHLARLGIAADDVPEYARNLSNILAFVEQLNEVNVDGVEPLTSVVEQTMKKRQDVVTDGHMPEKVTGNAPVADDNFFVVPKVVE